jgi:hypothetical protein
LICELGKNVNSERLALTEDEKKRKNIPNEVVPFWGLDAGAKNMTNLHLAGKNFTLRHRLRVPQGQ